MKIVVKNGGYMLEINEVIRIANKHFVEAMSVNEGKISIKSILLEEIFRDTYQDVPQCWHLTFGYYEIEDENNLLGSIIQNANPQRKYKTIILSPDGKFQAMKIRETEYEVINGGTF